MLDIGEPALQQGCGRRNGEHRGTGYHRQAEQQPQRRRCVGQRRTGAKIERQHQSRGRQHHGDMDQDLPPARQQTRQCVGIGVTEKQHRLEEYQTRAPHRRRTTEARQHHPGHHRLDQEHQPRAEEQRDSKARQHGGWRYNTGTSENDSAHDGLRSPDR